MVRGFVYILLSVVSFSSFAFEFSDQQTKNANKLMTQAMKDDLGYQVVESLTTEVGPRLAGSEAEARAREWAVKKLKALGFKNIRVEHFDVPLWTRGIETAEIISPFPQPLTITALGGSVSTSANGVEGEIYVVPSLKVLKKVKANALKGKIVFVDETMARTQDGSGYSAAVGKRRETGFEAHRVGAKAALIRSVGTSNHRFAHTGQMKRVTEMTDDPSVPTAALSAPDADQLARILNKTDKVRVKVTLTPQTRSQVQSGNVIAEIPGNKSPQEIVLIGAHLDSWDLGTGAIDDGAGVGIVVAAAHLIKSTLRKAPKRTIRVVLFGSEEVGLVGAYHYARKHKDELDQHIIAAESDFGADVVWQFGSNNVAEDKLDIIKAFQEVLRPLDIIPGSTTAYGGPDIKYLREMGVPVAELKQNGVDYFDLHHTPDDTLDKIDIDKLRQNIAAYAAFVYLATDIDEKFK